MRITRAGSAPGGDRGALMSPPRSSIAHASAAPWSLA
jgi:hypothetical protein